MSLPWFFEDVSVDHASLAWLSTVAGQTAVHLETAGAERLRRAADGLRHCRGPFAEELTDAVLRRAAREATLADDCRHLARRAVQASVEARAEQAHRLALRAAFEAELRRDEQRATAAAAARAAGVAGGGGTGEGW